MPNATEASHHWSSVIEAHRGTTVVGEMGTGKTFIAAAGFAGPPCELEPTGTRGS